MTISITISGGTLDEVLGVAARLAQGTPPAAFPKTVTPSVGIYPARPAEDVSSPLPAEEAPKPAEEAPRRRGRPPGSKKTEPVATPEEFPAEPAAPAPVEVPETAAPVDVATLRHTLIEVVKQKGRDACGELCRKHGGPNLSALNPAVYPALYADAQALLATDAQ